MDDSGWLDNYPDRPRPSLGIIGGSGLYKVSGLADVHQVEMETPYGKPSAPIVIGSLEGQTVAFLARHGIGHHIAPSQVPYQANIYALKQLGVQRIISISACGSLREDYVPGEVVIPDQLFDLTKNRDRTFFDADLVAHINVADPFCPDLSLRTYQSVQAAQGKVHFGGAFITIEGPRFSTKAESNTYRSWGISIIGMTTSPEAYLAREAELCYAVMAHVTDYDVWHTSEEPVTVDMVIEILHRNTSLAQESIKQLIRVLPDERNCNCSHALASALITQPDRVTAATRQRLALLVSKYLK